MNTEVKNNTVETILNESDVYKILGLKRDATVEDIRRGYIQVSRVCHPDKFPNNRRATEAFQKVSSAYDTLRNPSSKLAYDMASGGCNPFNFDGRSSFPLFSQLYYEFIEGEYENMLEILELVNRQTTDSAFDLGSAQEILKELRDFFIVGGKCAEAAKDELFRLLEIHKELSNLSYFNLLGRAQLTLKFSRVFLSIPMTINSNVNDSKLFNPNIALALHQIITLILKAEGSIDTVKGWLSKPNETHSVPVC